MTYFREAVVNTQEMLDLLVLSQRLNFKFASMASARRISTVTPSMWPHESPRVS